MAKYRFKTPAAVEDTVVGAYQKIEKGVVGSYKKIENSVVGSYKKVEQKFVGAFLEEIPEEAAGAPAPPAAQAETEE